MNNAIRTAFDFRINQNVRTSNGPGVVQGRIREGENIRLIVSHNPRVSSLPPEVLAGWRGGPWVLCHYDPDAVEAA